MESLKDIFENIYLRKKLFTNTLLILITINVLL
nr:MAG TPA: hypothetical protein [Bacteriophage sp.]DAI57953.1 MAG TPA: hypothetical protein [Caudoviricetes sp.]